MKDNKPRPSILGEDHMERKLLCMCICLLLMTAIAPSVGSIHNSLKTTTIPECFLPNLLATWTQEQKLLTNDGTFGDSFGYSVSVDGDTALIGAFGDVANGDLVGSAYIFTRTGTTWTQQAKLFPTAGRYYDFFGYAVCLVGDTALIGAPGSQFNPPYPGAAYIFIRNGATWTQQARLDPSDGADGDYFGDVVALDGETALIGSEYFTSTPGSAYVFTRAGTTWTQQAKIVPSDGINGEMFGYSVALQSNTALIGAVCDDDHGPCSGSAYVFTRTGTTWTQQAKLLAADGATLDSLGCSVVLDNDTALVGAQWDADNGYQAGSAFVFTRTGTTWTQQAKLLPSDGTEGDNFGIAVALSGDNAIIGAYYAKNYSGYAYVFNRSGTVWAQQAKLQPADITEGKLFGVSVSLSGDTALIGAYGDGDNGPGAGAAYVFIRSVNYPPNPPIITGTTNGKAGTSYDYTFTTQDPENDQIFLFIDWGDGTNSSWIGPYAPGSHVTKSHTWSKQGIYTIKAKAKDSSGNEGLWGTLDISMPCPFIMSLQPFFQRFFERFPNMFPILRRLLGY
jgi:hypothetical protein